MPTLAQAPVKTADHPSSYMTPERFAQWCADLQEERRLRGLPPEPWPLP